MKRKLTFIMLVSALLLSGCGTHAEMPDAANASAAPSPETVEESAAPAAEEAPESAESAGETEESVQDASCDVLFYGHSLTAYGKFNEYFPELKVKNLGIPGGMIEDMIERVPEVAACGPKKIFLMGGANDLVTEGDAEICAERYRELIDALREACPDAEILIESELPMTKKAAVEYGVHNRVIRDFNERAKAIAEEYGLQYIDVYSAYDVNGGMDEKLSSDGVHIKTEAYCRWVDIIRPYIESDGGENE